MTEPLDIVRRFYELARRDDWSRLELLSEDLVYRPIAEITEAGEYRGRDGFRGYMEDFFGSGWAEGLRIDTMTFRAYGDAIIARLKLAGHGRASGLGFAARVFVVHTVRNGRIVRIEDFTDRAEALRAAGVVPNVEALQRIYRGWAEGDLFAEPALYDPHLVYIAQVGDPDRGPHYGREALSAYARRFLQSWDGWRIEALDYREAGDSVLVRIRRTALGKASRLPVEDEAFQVWTFRGGKVIRLEVYQEEADALAALGMGA